jgi:ATP-dependent HslUV protease ATP-binding subunit HslU
MTIPLPERTTSALGALTPREIVAELDKHVVGQAKAKRAVAIALRDRTRRQKLPPEMAQEVTPKNILMIGPTGVGKTEIARRLARLAQSPFIKVEASKFTEVGYIGRDVESMIRDLVEIAVAMVREEQTAGITDRAAAAAEDRLLELLLPGQRLPPGTDAAGLPDPLARTRDRLREDLRAGRLDERVVELDTAQSAMPPFEVIGGSSADEIGANLKDMMGSWFGGRGKRRKLRVPEALRALTEEEQHKLVDGESVDRLAIARVEQSGIVFVDEIDKIASRDGGGHGPDVSREGVQRDILPIVEGTNVSTKHGMVKTDHILFIAAGAFHVSKPSDLIPELQGRFPIRVELEALTRQDFVRILTEPRSALIRQYTALMRTEGVELDFTTAAVERIADYAVRVNDRSENIGARRLHTVMERLLDEVSFEGADQGPRTVVIDEAYVDRMLADIVKNEDLSRYIL